MKTHGTMTVIITLELEVDVVRTTYPETRDMPSEDDYEFRVKDSDILAQAHKKIDEFVSENLEDL